MSENKSFLNAMIMLGLLLAIGMASAAFILGVQAKHAVTGQQTITVKGLAEKPVKADSAEWVLSIQVTDATQRGGLEKLNKERQTLENFLIKQGLPKESWLFDTEIINDHYDEVFVKDSPRQVRNGYDVSQTVRISSRDLAAITQANQSILELRADSHPIFPQAPQYLVSDLESIKMSLIADATKNARNRATEFVKQDGVKVGVMKSASQGAFYILPVGGNNEDSDNSYGGVYDKSTIHKTARVVVTIVYNIE
ncbi:MAG TPA: SIMPL domain-containing protein [Methylophilaceae bacterium]|nr:SIMPL domain-containing protein [Methylophilaceae bacterium]